MGLLALALYPVFLVSALFISVLLALSNKRIRARFKFDALPFYMVLYLANVAYVFGVLKAGVAFLVITTIIMLFVIVRVSKVQLIGVTGSPGSGKTAIAKILSEDFKLEKIELNDLLNRVIKQKSTADTLVKEFGGEILDDKKEINQKFLHETIFPRDVIKKKYVKIIEMPLLLELAKELYNVTGRTKEAVVLDAPLLFDFKFIRYISFPNIVVFNTESALPVKRVAERDHIPLSEASKLVATAQGQIGHMLKNADVQVKNDEDLTALKYNLINQLGSFLL